MKVFVTGARGFLGRHVVESLRSQAALMTFKPSRKLSWKARPGQDLR